MKITPLFRVLSGFLSASKTNVNADRIEAALQNTLSRDGSEPNAMADVIDMGGNRIINVGHPTDPNDAVRLQDLDDIVAGDFTVSAAWDDIEDKPDEFPPEDHTHTSADITGLEEFVEDKVAEALVAGTGVAITYDDGANTIEITATGTAANDWNTTVNKPSTFPPDSHTHAEADVTGLTAALAAKANTSHTHLLADITDYAASSGSMTMPNFVDVFSGNPNGVTSNDVAFTNAEASAYERIWLPEGTYYTTKSNSFFNKWYEGPGKILISSGTSVLPGKKSLVSNPSFNDSIVTEYGEAGDTKFSNIQYEYVRTGARQRVLTQHKTNANYGYFQAGAAAKFVRYFSLSGGSGTSAHLTAAANSGATTCQVNSTSGISPGDTIGFNTNDGVAPGDIVTVTTVPDSTTINFTPALANTYPYAGPDYAVPSYVSGYATNSRVMKGMRTNNQHYFFTLDSTGEGDVYGILGRISNSYVLKAGQTDFFEGCTVAFIGGDMQFTGDGQYGTPWEFIVSDSGHDVAVINPTTYTRTNDTGGRRVTWIHDLCKSEGTKPIDVAWSLHGKARVGMDLSTADFSSDGERAIQMKLGQRIYFDGTASAGAAGIGTRARGFWGNIQGDTYLTASNDGSDRLEMWAGGNRSFSVRASSISTNVQLNTTASINASGSVAIGATTGAFYMNGLGGNTYLNYDAGSNVIRLFKNGVQVATW